MKSAGEKFLKVTLTTAGSPVRYIPLSSIFFIKRNGDEVGGGDGTMNIVYKTAAASQATITITELYSGAANDAQVIAIMDEFESDLVDCIEKLTSGSKSVVVYPGQEGNCIARASKVVTFSNTAYVDGNDTYLTITEA